MCVCVCFVDYARQGCGALKTSSMGGKEGKGEEGRDSTVQE